MSFSGEVRGELAEIIPEARHCRIAELRAIVDVLGSRSITEPDGRRTLVFRTESQTAGRKLFTLMKKTFNMDVVVQRTGGRPGGHRDVYEIRAGGPGADAMLKAIRHATVLNLPCCRRAFLRGAFLAAGSVSAPEKSYHLEISCSGEGAAGEVQNVCNSLGFTAKTVLRKNDYVVYLKEGDQIVTMLGEMGAARSYLAFENARVVKEMKETVNRKVNCETANLNKTVKSSVRQCEDIRLIQEKAGFSGLTPALREMAKVRLENPDMPLGELGNLLDPKIGKSGVNHRLRKLSEIAEHIRELERLKEEDYYDKEGCSSQTGQRS